MTRTEISKLMRRAVLVLGLAIGLAFASSGVVEKKVEGAAICCEQCYINFDNCLNNCSTQTCVDGCNATLNNCTRFCNSGC